MIEEARPPTRETRGGAPARGTTLEERRRVLPTVMRVGPYRFFVYSNEGNEPPHIHVAADGNECTFWLSPVALARNRGFGAHELHDIEAIVQAHAATMIGAWNAPFGTR